MGYRFVRSEVDDDPLRMGRIGLPGEFAGQVRIAFPEGLGIAVSNPRIAVFGAAIARVAAVGERISVRVANGIFQLGAAGEVSTLVGLVAPAAIGIPVPGSNR